MSKVAHGTKLVVIVSRHWPTADVRFSQRREDRQEAGGHEYDISLSELHNPSMKRFELVATRGANMISLLQLAIASGASIGNPRDDARALEDHSGFGTTKGVVANVDRVVIVADYSKLVHLGSPWLVTRHWPHVETLSI